MGQEHNLRGDQFRMEYLTRDTGGSKPRHVVKAFLGDGDTPLGSMGWTSDGITSIDVYDPNNTRKGIATAMWEHGHRLAEENARIPKPKHSSDRTREGDAWARAVGGRLPRRKQ
jgi:hypothetical protein